MADKRAVVGMYSFKSTDPQRLATFWGELMELPRVDVGSDLVMLDFDHEVTAQTWLFERADDVTAGEQLGIDIGIDDDANWADVADRAEALGATRDSEHEEDGVRWIVMHDPDGNRFRVFAPRPV
ncbi:VOC family protein [Prauserella cavernicola]|uniref:VOC domain-containing protein n=1 Tax=Prauserella cavernicola TaxID=2800127 RepID=A0A934QT35_9PSEU|nr:VOC family protein [Prauserella cavernicola]MBK1785746.1 hypothetical protein [Prauserella cavernicola]